jgi:hypothetical protein
MTLDAFRQLQPDDKVALVVAAGTHLAKRRQNQRDVHLYFLPNAGVGFFVEVSYEPVLESIMVLRSFTETAPLVDYAHHVRLPL